MGSRMTIQDTNGRRIYAIGREMRGMTPTTAPPTMSASILRSVKATISPTTSIANRTGTQKDAGSLRSPAGLKSIPIPDSLFPTPLPSRRLRRDTDRRRRVVVALQMEAQMHCEGLLGDQDEQQDQEQPRRFGKIVDAADELLVR